MGTLPIIKRRTVTKGKTGEEVTTIKLGGFGQRGSTAWTGFSFGVGEGTRQEGAKMLDIYLQGLRQEGEGVSLNFQEFPDSLFELCEQTAETGKSDGGVAFRPKEGDQALAAMGLSGDGQVSQ